MGKRFEKKRMLYTDASMVRVCEMFKRERAIVTNVNFDHELALVILKDFLVGLSSVKTNWAEHCFWRLVNVLLAPGLPAKDMLNRV